MEQWKINQGGYYYLINWLINTVIDQMIDIGQHTDMEDFSQLPFSLTASMPPPDCFDGRTVVNPADVERVD